MDQTSDKLEFEDYFLKSGQIFISGEIVDETYLRVSQQLRYMNYLEINPVKIFLNSPGGEVENAMAIIDEFRLFQRKDVNKEIWTIAIGQACSSAAFILAYGSRRFATDCASLMIHPMSYDQGEVEHQASFAYAKFAEQLYQDLMMPLAYRCGCKSKKAANKFIESIRDGKWMNAEEAKEFGLIDEIWDYSLERL